MALALHHRARNAKESAMSKHKHNHSIRCASHLEPMLTPERARFTVRQVIKMIKARDLKFDTIACRGVSGLLIAPVVAMRLNKTLLVVRKGENTHSTHAVEGDYGAKRYLILDDFIDGGSTVRAIVEGIYGVSPKARCVGFIAYKRLSYLPIPYSFTPSFEAQMKRAWWDLETTYVQRFFPERYNKAVEREQEAQYAR
jgi:adenine/guanine phosphoribosyltransferase-like PRPP-binding protein